MSHITISDMVWISVTALGIFGFLAVIVVIVVTNPFGSGH